MTLEKEGSLRSQNATIEDTCGKHRKSLPYAFTEQGDGGLNLKSQIATSSRSGRPLLRSKSVK